MWYGHSRASRTGSYGPVYPDIAPSGHMRSEVATEEDCPDPPDKPSCGSQCPPVFDSADVQQNCKIIYCLTASKEDYAKAAFQFNTAMPKQPNPCAVVMATNVSCLSAVIKYVTVAHKDLRIAVRGGRHSYIGASTASNGVVVDVSGFNTVQQDNDKELMTVGAGITLVQLYYQLWERGLMYPGGTCPTVGLSGLTLGGGQGVIGRKYGLSTDQVVQAKMVNNKGEVLVANSTHKSDLYWALRGGGNGNFGVVFQFTLKRYPIPDVSVDYLIYFHKSEEWYRVFDQWQNVITSDEFVADPNTWSQLTIAPGYLHVAFHIIGGQRNQYFNTLTSGTTPSGYKATEPFINCSYTPSDYAGSIAFWAGCTGHENKCGKVSDIQKCLDLPSTCGGRAFRMNSGYQSGRLPPAGINVILENIASAISRTNCSNVTLQMDTLGGRIKEITPSETAFPHRDNTFGYQFITYFDYDCEKNEPQILEWLANFYNNMSPYMTNGSYRNYANPNLEDFNERYFLENYGLLIRYKDKYDHENVFHYSQSIPLSVRIELAFARALPYVLPTVIIVILGWLATRYFCKRQPDREKKTN